MSQCERMGLGFHDAVPISTAATVLTPLRLRQAAGGGHRRPPPFLRRNHRPGGPDPLPSYGTNPLLRQRMTHRPRHGPDRVQRHDVGQMGATTRYVSAESYSRSRFPPSTRTTTSSSSNCAPSRAAGWGFSVRGSRNTWRCVKADRRSIRSTSSRSTRECSCWR
jgi:hypothetical protein